MTYSSRYGWVRLLRPTWRRLVVLAAIIAIGCLYQMFFTPQKRIVRQRLSEANAKSTTAINTRLKPLTNLFAKGRKGAKYFAEDALSWSSKYNLVKGMIDGKSHRAYLSEAYERHIFSSDELKNAMESAVKALIDDIEGYEGEMLVLLRADLADTVRPDTILHAHLLNGEDFSREYKKMSRVVITDLHIDLGVTVGRLVGTEIAALAVVQAAKSAAAELGISAGILGTGLSSTLGTIGVGMVLGFIIDYMVEELLKLAGYDPVAKIEAAVIESINKLEKALINDPNFFSAHFTTQKKGTLRLQMEQLHETRSKLRRESINRLLTEGGK